jgi:GH25 family lysozyme M1 (1,4-beta-N-acetylmuramidase)
MTFSPLSQVPRSAPRKLAATGVLGASFALLVTTAGTATAKPSLPLDIPLGQGRLGVGYLIDDPGSVLPVAPPPTLTANPVGIDVSHYQGSINWTSVKRAGISFAWIKATEGTTYKDPKFNTNYPNAYKAGVIRGAYHFARPDSSSGAAQASYFASHGGAWSRDNKTLPGVLDIEGGCYGKSTSSMRSWILDFYTTYKSKTRRDVVIYTSASWWNKCTGSWSGMASRSPLWDAHWTSASSPTLPKGFPYWTVWQYTSSGKVSGISGNVDRDRFNGSASRLLALANNT